jgi:aldose 1-epimerase
VTTVEGLLVLQQQQTRLTLDPRRGGVIRELSWHGHDILRPTAPAAGDDPFQTACFPMAPYVNRIAHGRFGFGGHAVHLQRNWDQDPHPLHGQGWRAAWAVTAASKANATIHFEGGGDEWPWRYRCEQRFQVLPESVSVELAIQNLGSEPMPAMLGLHPYFPDAGRAQLQAQLPGVWLADSQALPTQESRTPEAWNFDSARAVSAVGLDHGFTGWNGVALLSWPDRTVTVRAPDCRFLHVYTPTGRDFFCIEPQTAAPGALGRDPAEASVVAPGGRLSMRVHLSFGAN